MRDLGEFAERPMTRRVGRNCVLRTMDGGMGAVASFQRAARAAWRKLDMPCGLNGERLTQINAATAVLTL
jgi:hypothetical protein